MRADDTPGHYDAGSNAHVYGALVIANLTSSHSGESRVLLNSNAGIFYCTDALDLAGLVAGSGVTVANWHTKS